jgi:hypothetical protein
MRPHHNRLGERHSRIASRGPPRVAQGTGKLFRVEPTELAPQRNELELAAISYAVFVIGADARIEDANALTETLTTSLDDALKYRGSCGFMLIAVDNLARINAMAERRCSSTTAAGYTSRSRS